jgi:hypothetical protein
MVITFTKAQIQALQHRLDAPDAILDSLCESSFSEDKIEMAISVLSAEFNSGVTSITLEQESPWAEVLEDCVSGSTLVAAFADDPKMAGIKYKLLSRIASKIQPMFGDKIEIPTG